MSLHDGLRTGAITLTVRRWARPQAKVGGRYRSGGGLLEVTAIEQVPARAITDTDARRCGSSDRVALFTAIGVGSDDDLVYRIDQHPARRAGDLADMAGRERLAFKADVRKLKGLGLTQSLEVGYRLSSRGEAYLRLRGS